MQFAPAPSSISNVRDFFSRSDKEKIPPDLKRALSLLNLSDLASLEERFLATTAFLEPWVRFRDTCLLVNPSRTAEPSSITRLDILWFYTQFDEGIRRHDPRTERADRHFEIDKSEWSAADYEKHLYAWLLQSFCVGKAYSPFRFQYFELKNICAAWEEVFVPIVKAVRASYSVKGRRHYGRLALFIEDRCPSRLAFPEGNVIMPDGVVTSPTPFRMVSRPSHLRGASQTVLTKKNYDEAEQELRNVYPQYGGLVERPRFKQKMDEWLEEQRMRAAHRKTIAKPETVQYVPSYQPQVVEQSSDAVRNKSPTKDTRSRSPIKRYSDTIRRSLSLNVTGGRFGKAEPSPLEPTRPKTPDTPKVPMIPYGMYSYVPKLPEQEPKSPLHGVTRQIHIPDEIPRSLSPVAHVRDASSSKAAIESDTWPLPPSGLPRPVAQPRQASGQSVYTSIRTSNPFQGGGPAGPMGVVQRQSANSDDSVYSPMGALSAIPRPLYNDRSRHDESVPGLPLQPKKSSSGLRCPSYEGNGYHEEISLTNLHTRNVSAGGQSVENEKPKPRSHLPAPIRVPPPYNGQLRVASNDTYHNGSPPKPKMLPWPGESLPKPVAWPGLDDSPPRAATVTPAIAPPIPVKSPERWASRRGQRSEQLRREDAGSHHVVRIVSKENIRAALGGLSRESSIEDMRAHPAVAPSRVASPPRLETYNTHMFPRKETRPDANSGW